MNEQSLPNWLLKTSVTARYLQMHSIPCQAVWNKSGKGVVSCSDVSVERNVDESNVAKTVVAVARGQSGGPPIWVVAVVCGDDLVDWKKLKGLVKDVIGKRDLTAVPMEDLLDFGIPVGAIAPPQFLDLPISVYFAVDAELLSPEVNSSSDVSIDFSSGLRLVGLQLSGTSVQQFFQHLGARSGRFSKKSVVDFPIALRELPVGQRVDVVELLALLAQEDGERCGAETNFLVAVASRLAVDGYVSNVLVDTEGHKPADRNARAIQLIANLKDLNGKQRNWIVFLMALLAHADDECDMKEEDRIKAWAVDLDVSLHDIHSLLLLGACVRHNEIDLIRRLNSQITEQFSDVIQSVTDS